MCSVRLYYFLLTVFFYTLGSYYTFSEVEIMNSSKKSLLVGYKSGGELINEGQNAWRLNRKQVSNVSLMIQYGLHRAVILLLDHF